MIRRDNYWVYIEAEGNELEDPRTTGKWIVVGPTVDDLDVLIETIDDLVEEGRLYKVKFPHQEHPDYDFGRYPLPPICFYADNPTRRTILSIIKDELGLDTDEWKYDGE